jgi:hypothetical protein
MVAKSGHICRVWAGSAVLRSVVKRAAAASPGFRFQGSRGAKARKGRSERRHERPGAFADTNDEPSLDDIPALLHRSPICSYGFRVALGQPPKVPILPLVCSRGNMQVGPTAVPAALKSVFDGMLLTLDSNCGEPSSVLHPRRPTYPALPVGLGLSTPANVHVPGGDKTWLDQYSLLGTE